MEHNVYPVVLAGGSGSRFWPRSREALPKQLLSLTGGLTLLQATVERLRAALPGASILVATSRAYAAEVRRQLPDLPADALIEEPLKRDTGPAMALAATVVAGRFGNSDALLLFTPSDHWIDGQTGFRRTVMAALAAAGSPAAPLVTIGIAPSRPETGFGYIHAGRSVARYLGRPVLSVLRFIEKPDRRRAAALVRQRRYLWNSGILACSAAAALAALTRHEPAIGRLLDPLAAAVASGDPGRMDETYAKMPPVSFDRAVLERSDHMVTVPALFRWDDLGTWSALARVMPTDRDGNLMLGPVVSAGASRCLVDAGGKPVALLGVRDLIIVDAGDVLLIADRSRDQEIRQLREMVKRAGLGHLL